MHTCNFFLRYLLDSDRNPIYIISLDLTRNVHTVTLNSISAGSNPSRCAYKTASSMWCCKNSLSCFYRQRGSCVHRLNRLKIITPGHTSVWRWLGGTNSMLAKILPSLSRLLQHLRSCCPTIILSTHSTTGLSKGAVPQPKIEEFTKRPKAGQRIWPRKFDPEKCYKDGVNTFWPTSVYLWCTRSGNSFRFMFVSW